MVGCETAVDLGQTGQESDLVEQLPQVPSSGFVPSSTRGCWKDMMDAYGVEVCANYKLLEVTDEGAVLEVARKLFTLGQTGEVLTSMTLGERRCSRPTMCSCPWAEAQRQHRPAADGQGRPCD